MSAYRTGRRPGRAGCVAGAIRSYSVRLSLTGSGQLSDTVSGTMQLRVKPSLLAAMNLTIGAGSATEPFSEILTPKAAYLKMPGLGRPSKPWVWLPSPKAAGAGAVMGQLLQSIETSNPQNQAEMLTASKDLRTTGTQIIGGIPKTRYTGSYSISAALRKLPAGLRRQSGPAVRSLGVSAVHFTVWIDGQHRTRQIVIVESGKGATITSRLQISAINEPVHVTFPPASQVAALPAAPKSAA